MQGAPRSFDRRDALRSLASLCAIPVIAESGFADDPPVPARVSALKRVWTWDVPSGVLSRSSVVQPLTRIAVYTSDPLDAADAVCDSILRAQLESNEVGVLLQGFGMGGGSPTGPKWIVEGTTKLFLHPKDGVTPSDGLEWWVTPWFSTGVTSCSRWMTRFIERWRERQANGEPIPDPCRFHFDSEEWPQVVTSPLGAIGAFRAMQNDPRWTSEPILGFNQSIEAIWVSANRPSFDQTKYWFDPVNRDWSCWYQGVLFTGASAAMQAAAGSVIKEAWPNCGVSNYGTSTSFDGVDGRFDVDSRNPWLKYVHRSASDIQAPVFYNRPTTGNAELDRASETKVIASTRSSLSMMMHSFGGCSPSSMVPWIELVGERSEGAGSVVTTPAFSERIIGLLNEQQITECIVWSDPSANKTSNWDAFAPVVGVSSA
ncbi:MAG: hypothetical protein O2800_01615 [Planctomycetota bacterium]|nr:hypothetical protein [Planctomycetota bacterium]